MSAAELQAEFKKQLSAAITAALQRPEFTISGVGLIRDVAVAKVAIDPIDVRMGGKLHLDSIDVDFPIEVSLLPQFKVHAPDRSKLEAVLLGKLGTILNLPGIKEVGAPIKNLNVKVEPVVAVGFDLELDYRLVQGLEPPLRFKAAGIEITRHQIQRPAAIEAGLPELLLPGGFVLARPTIGVPLDGKLRLLMRGDLTYGNGQLAHIAKIVSSLEARFDGSPYAKAEGDLVIGGMVKVFKMDGRLDLGAAEAEMHSRTVGPVEKLLSVDSRTLLRAKERTYWQRGNMRALGFELIDSDVLIDGRSQRVTANQKAALPLGARANLELSTDMRLHDVRGRAAYAFSVGGFDIDGARLVIEPGLAELGYSYWGVDFGFRSPNAWQITPGMVLDAMKSIFDVRFDRIWDALRQRKIVISLLPAGNGDNRPVGSGDPIQGSTAANTAPARGEEEGGGDKHDTGPTPPEPPSRRPPEEEPIYPPVIVHLHGNVRGIHRFVRSGQPHLWREEFAYPGGRVTTGHYLVSDAVRNHFMGGPKPVVVSSFTVPATAFPSVPQPVRCTFGNEHPTYDVALTVSGDGKRFHVVAKIPGGVVRPLTLNAANIGQPKEADLSKRFSEGDVRLLTDAATAELIKGRPLEGLRRHPKAAPLTLGSRTLEVPEFYSYTATLAHGEALVLQGPTSDLRVEIDGSSRLGQLLRDPRSGPQALKALKVLVACKNAVQPLAWAYGEPAKPWIFMSTTGGESEGMLIVVLPDGGIRATIVEERTVATEKNDLRDGRSKQPTAEATRFLEALSAAVTDHPLAIGGLVASNDSSAAAPAVIHRYFFVRDVAAPNWKITFLQYAVSGPRRDFVRWEIDGSRLDEEFRKWQAPGFGMVRVAGASLALDSETSRRWFIRSLITPPDAWQKDFAADPFLLVLRSR